MQYFDDICVMEMALACGKCVLVALFHKLSLPVKTIWLGV